MKSVLIKILFDTSIFYTELTIPNYNVALAFHSLRSTMRVPHRILALAERSQIVLRGLHGLI